MRNTSLAALAMVAALVASNGCTGGDVDRGATASAAALSERETPSAAPSGTQLKVRLASNLSSETAQVGDPWSGTLVAALAIGGREVLPAGTMVSGVVTGSHPAGLGTRAMLDLAIEDVSIAGASQTLVAGTEAIVADLPSTPSPADAPVGGRTSASMAGGEAEPVRPVGRGSEVVLEPGTELVFTVKEGAPAR